MASRVKAAARDLYTRDVYAWSSEQASLLRARGVTDLDLEQNLARFYEVARAGAAALLRERGEEAAADALPATRSYPLDQITGDRLP